MSWSVWPRPRNRSSTRRSPTSRSAVSENVRSGGSMTTSARSSASSGTSVAIRALRASPVRSRNGPQPHVTPDRGGPEDVVAEGVVEVAVRVDDDRDRGRRQLAKVVEDLATLDVGRSRVDDHDLVAAHHDPDVLVEERVSTHEHPVADLDPARHAGHGSRGEMGETVRGLTSDLVLTKLRAMNAAATTTGTRQTADERRDAIIAAALHEFAQGGYAGTSTESIARRRRRVPALPLPAVRHEAAAVPGRGPALVPSATRLVFHEAARRGPTDDQDCTILDLMGQAYMRLLVRSGPAAGPAPGVRGLRRRGRPGGRPRGVRRPVRVRRARQRRDEGGHPPLLRGRDAPERRRRPRDRRRPESWSLERLPQHRPEPATPGGAT